MVGKKEQGTAGGAGKVAVYARLSVNENGERDESLDTQCGLLAGFIEEHSLGESELYVDSDVSGTNFNRPGLARMTNDINCGLVDTVVVKDLSRLGRNNGETLTFLDYLQEKNVRLISLGDDYDSFRDDDDTIGIRTWVNEYYARDISKKVRANLKKKMQSGEYLGRPPFGYRKSGRWKNRLEVDERYRELIREIFTLYIQGWGYRALADYVQRLGVPTPGRDKGYAGVPGAGRWEGQHIRRIITNRVYCGDAVQGVREKVSFKSRKTRRLPGEKWIVVPGTHEAIVSRDTFELAQQVRERRWLEGAGRKSARASGVHLFTGLLVCAACGSRHVYRRKGRRPGGYVCGRYNRHGCRGCSSHHIAESELVSLIHGDVLEMAAGVPFRNRLYARYKEELSGKDGIDRLKTLAGEIKTRQRQLKTVYLDKLRGHISEELFMETSAVLQQEISTLTRQYEKLRAVTDGEFRPAKGIEIINSLELKMLNESDIDRFFLELFVKKIIVLEKGDINCDWAAKESVLRPVMEGLKHGERRTAEPGLVIVYNLAP